MRFTIAVLIIFCTISIKAQSVYEFLELDKSPRAAALAGSYVANNGDPNIIFYNPAGIVFLENTPVSFSFLKHLLDINSASLSGSYEYEGIGRFAAGITYINYGDFTEADEFGNETGDFGAGEFAFVLGYANKLDENFYYGVNLKYIHSSIADYSSSGAAIDLGLHYAIPGSGWNFGFSVLNLGTQLSKYSGTSESLPLDIRIGGSKVLEHTPFKLYFSVNKLNEEQDSFFDRFKHFTVGSEISVANSVNLRIGYDNEKRDELSLGSSTGLAGFNLGLGFTVSEYVFDYAYSSLGSIGGLHRVGITTEF